MKRYLIIILIKSILYLLLYWFIHTLLNTPAFLPIITTILIFVIFDKTIHNKIDKFISSIFFKKIYRIENILAEFNVNINGIIHYKKLINKFSYLFDRIFTIKKWALYILENDIFILSKSRNIAKEIPNEISWSKSKDLKLFYELDSQDDGLSFENSELLDSLKSLNLNLFIPITGKNQVIALLFTNIKNKFLFRDPNINELVVRILQKGGNFLENTALYLDLLNRNLQIKKLFEISEKLLSSLDTNEILEFILESLKEVIPFDAAIIFLIDSKNGNLLQKASYGYDEESQDLSIKIGQGACGWVAQNKKISLIDDAKKAKYYYPLREETQSQVALPLIIHDEVLGVICLEKNEKSYFTNNTIELLNIFANQAAIALDNAKQYEISIAKKSLESELIKAGNVQKVLLPKIPPHYKNLDISFINIPSKIVSGDLYDLIPMDNNHLGFIIGDIAGKGAGAAIMMSLLLAGFRAYKKTHFTACETVARLNNLLEESISDYRYATFFYGIISMKEKKITYTNAGHNPPILLRKNGAIDRLNIGGIVLGYLANETYKQEEIQFESDDLLVLYTDGISEAMNADAHEFGDERLLKAVIKNREKSSYEIKSQILQELKKFTGNSEPDDDATLLIIKYT